MTPPVVGRFCFLCGESTRNGAIACECHEEQGVIARRVRTLIVAQGTEKKKMIDPAYKKDLALYKSLCKDNQYLVAYLVGVLVARMREKSIKRRGIPANIGVYGGLDLILALAKAGYL